MLEASMRALLLSVASVFIYAAVAMGTTVIRPTFEKLVADADLVFEGEVIDVRSQLIANGPDQAISTFVSFRVVKILKGSAPAVTVLEFLGGTAGGRTMIVDGIPHFANGDRDILFVDQKQRMISPLVGLNYGRFRIVGDAGDPGSRVYGFGGVPLSFARSAELGTAAAAVALPMSLTEVENTISTEIARQKESGAR
jgi:hypothetical protein